MSRSEASLARMLFGRTRTLSDEQRGEQSERARKTIRSEELWLKDRAARRQDPQRPLCGCWHTCNDRRPCPLGLFRGQVGHAPAKG